MMKTVTASTKMTRSLSDVDGYKRTKPRQRRRGFACQFFTLRARQPGSRLSVGDIKNLRTTP